MRHNITILVTLIFAKCPTGSAQLSLFAPKTRALTDLVYLDAAAPLAQEVVGP